MIVEDNTVTIAQALAPVDRDGQQMIDARSLHGWLGAGQRFNDWMRRRVDEYGRRRNP